MAAMWLLIAFVVGILFGGLVAHLWTSREELRRQNKLSTKWEVANVEKEVYALRGYIEGQNAALADFTVEQKPPVITDKGLFKKTYFMLLQERLVYKGIPFPWWTSTTQVAERLDGEALIKAAKAASVLVKSFDLKGLGIQMISKVLEGSRGGSATLSTVNPSSQTDGATIDKPGEPPSQ
jgi:hypothetical protein